MFIGHQYFFDRNSNKTESLSREIPDTPRREAGKTRRIIEKIKKNIFF